MKIDETDQKILQILQQNGRITNSKLAKHIGISPPAMLERVKRLEAAGVISKFVALVDPEKIGIGVLVFVNVTLAVHQMPSVGVFEEKIGEMDEVLECYQVSGEYDYLLKVCLKNVKGYSDFAFNRLAAIPGVERIRSAFILKSPKVETGFPVEITKSA